MEVNTNTITRVKKNPKKRPLYKFKSSYFWIILDYKAKQHLWWQNGRLIIANTLSKYPPLLSPVFSLCSNHPPFLLFNKINFKKTRLAALLGTVLPSLIYMHTHRGFARIVVDIRSGCISLAEGQVYTLQRSCMWTSSFISPRPRSPLYYAPKAILDRHKYPVCLWHHGVSIAAGLADLRDSSFDISHDWLARRGSPTHLLTIDGLSSCSVVGGVGGEACDSSMGSSNAVLTCCKKVISFIGALKGHLLNSKPFFF